MKQLTLMIFAALLGSASAQFNLRVFELDQLSSLPGEIKTSTSFSALIQFEGEITQVLNPREDMIEDIREGSFLYVKAILPAGETNLWVTTQGKVAGFTVRIDESLSHGWHYRVDNQPTPVDNGVQPTPMGAEPTSARTVSQSEPLAAWTKDVPYTFDADVVARTSDAMRISYTLVNHSSFSLFNDSQRLRIVVDGEVVTPQISRSPTGPAVGRVFGKQSEIGQIEFRAAEDSDVELTWELVEMGTGEIYTIRESF